MVAELTALRDQIDEVDKALLSLLAKRLELVAEVGEVKSQYGLPIYVPERESAMLASRREEAAALGVPPDLIEDVLRRVMRESYSSENDKGFKTLQPNLRPVVIVEGDGGFQLDKNADSTQRILFQFSVGNGDTIADPGTAHFFAGEDRFEHHLRRQT